MRKIRIGKDIQIRWGILTNGIPVSLEGRDLSLVLNTPIREKLPIEFTVDGNTIIATYRGAEHRHLGDYSLTLWENYGKDKQTAVDSCLAFRLVATTCDEESCQGGNLSTGVSINLSSKDLELLPTYGVYSKTVKKIEVLTQEEYEQIENPSPTTMYVIV